MAQLDDDEAVNDLVHDIKRRERMTWIMNRFEGKGYRRRNVFSVDEAINWWLTYKPRIVPTDEEL